MVKAISWREGFRSAPFNGGIGSILSKGLEVRRVNRQKENITWHEIEKTAFVKFLSEHFVRNIKLINQAFIARIQSKREPSCAPQVAANL